MPNQPRYRLALSATTLVIVAVILLLVPTVPTAGSGGATPGGATGISVPAGVTPAAAAGTAGATVGGLTCKQGVRQVSWSVYVPECVPAYKGDNGGSTSPGVTKSTITFTYRLASSSALSDIYAFFPKNVVGDNSEVIETYQSYMKVFNKYFELYGRHVQLDTFNGQGNFIDELTGGGQVGAQADAVTEKSLPTFADVSLADSSPLFVNDLASQGLISTTLWPPYAAWMSQRAPYVYSTGPDCNKRSEATAAFMADELHGLPAIFSGDPSAISTKRKIGYVYQLNPYESPCEQIFVSDLAKYHLAVDQLDSYVFDFASFLSQTSAIIAKLKAAGITTVILPADPVSPTLFMQAAAAQNYFPEWVYLLFFGNGAMNDDPLGRLPPQSEMAHALTLGIADQAITDQESYKVFEMGCQLPPKTDCSDPLPAFSMANAYSTLLMLFSGIQTAGPYLTPQTFAKGVDSLPGGPASGMFGEWAFGTGTVDPPASFQIMKWEPGITSVMATQVGVPVEKGAWVACNGGQQYLYSDPAIPKGRQPSCPRS